MNNTKLTRLSFTPVPYEASPAKRLVWQEAYIAKWPDTIPKGQYVGHCGQWQLITHLPHVCVCCGVRLFEEMTHG